MLDDDFECFLNENKTRGCVQRAGGVLSGLSGTHWRPLSGEWDFQLDSLGLQTFGVAAPDFKAMGIWALISHSLSPPVLPVRDTR